MAFAERLASGAPVSVQWLDAVVDIEAGGKAIDLEAIDEDAITETIGWLIKVEAGQLLLAMDWYPHTGEFRTVMRIPTSLVRELKYYGRGRQVSLTAKETSTPTAQAPSSSKSK